MPSARLTHLPDLLELHVEELAFLWGQRQTALRDPDYTIREFAHLEDRIVAHREGVRTVGDHALPLLEAGLAQDDPQEVFAAAYALLHFGSPSATQRVIDAFRDAEGPRLTGLEEALRHGPLDNALGLVQLLSQNGRSPVAVAAATALAFHSAFHPVATAVQRFLQDDDPLVRRQGWALVAYLGMAIEPKTYAAAVRDPDPAVQRAALEAGAWSGERGVLAVCRKLAADLSPPRIAVLELLAVLGGPDDVRLFATVACADALGPARFQLVGTYGHPSLMDLVLAALTDPDPAIAAAAGSAFTKITGQNIDSERRERLPPENGAPPDDFEAEFQEEVTLPDAELAQRHWELIKSQVAGAARVRRSFNVGTALTGDVFAELDMESRWEISLRARFQGIWSGSPLRIERFASR